jgi:hypothetical protein
VKLKGMVVGWITGLEVQDLAGGLEHRQQIGRAAPRNLARS